MRASLRIVVVAGASAVGLVPYLSCAASDAIERTHLADVSVTATRLPRKVDAIAGTVTVKDASDIEKELVGDIADLIRYEPGISVSNAPARFGLAGFTIRGIDGNRILVRIDDVRMADAFQIGSFSDARRNLIDLDAVKSVEIVRGAASALYGSDAIGGVVSFISKDPLDYLDRGERAFVAAKTGFDSDNDGTVLGSTIALGDEHFSGLVTLTHRTGHERDNQGESDTPDRNRTEPNPQDSTLDGALARIVWRPNERHTLRVLVNADRNDVETNVLSSVGATGAGPTAVNTLSMTGDDQQRRQRISISDEWIIGTLLADSLRWQVYTQRTDIEQRTEELRYGIVAGPDATVQRERVFDFEQASSGLELLAHLRAKVGRSEHVLTYGIEGFRTRTEQLRDGLQTNLATGMQTRTLLPDVFPVRDFPKTRTDQLAAFVQDEIDISEGRWRITPGVRIDRYKLDPEPDAIFNQDNPGALAGEIEETSVSPKLGIVWDFGEREDLSAYVHYAHGFRAPPYNDVNIGFTNLAFGYTAIANPDLKPETSDGYEIGFRGSYDLAHFSLAAFHNEYDDFIESLALVGVQDGLQVFQSRNVARARIQGIELRSGWDLKALDRRLSNWTMKLSVAFAEGEDLTADAPLNSIDPLKAVLGIAYAPAADNWSVEIAATGVDRKSRIDASAAPQFSSPAYLTLDVFGHLDIGERISLNAGIFNLTDKKYWTWSDVRGRSSTDPAIDRYTQPGINAALHASIRF